MKGLASAKNVWFRAIFSENGQNLLILGLNWRKKCRFPGILSDIMPFKMILKGSHTSKIYRFWAKMSWFCWKSIDFLAKSMILWLFCGNFCEIWEILKAYDTFKMPENLAFCGISGQNSTNLAQICAKFARNLPIYGKNGTFLSIEGR